MNYRLFVELCIEALQVNLPVEITVVDSDLVEEPGGNALCEGYCLSDGEKHCIEVAKSGSRPLHTLIAHELVHAYVAEQYPRAKWHGYVFRRVARYLESHLAEEGHGLSEPIYLADCDE